MTNWLLLLAALSGAPTAVAVPGERLEHQGMAYEIIYQPVVTRSERTITSVTVRGHRLQWCRLTTRIALDGEVRLPDGTAAAAQRLPGERRISSQFAGSCDANRAAIAAAETRHRLAVDDHVRALAALARPALLARIDAARAWAVN